MSFSRRFASVASVLALGAVGALGVALPAQASPYIKVCNAGSSDDRILAYNDSVRKEYLIGMGSCVSVDNYGGNARVDVDPSGGYADINSWYKEGPTTGAFSPCYAGENGASNPYNSGFTRYFTSNGTMCQ